MTNVDKLKGAIKEKRLTPEKVAESIGIDKVRCIVNFLTVVRILPLSRQTLSHKFSVNR